MPHAAGALSEADRLHRRDDVRRLGCFGAVDDMRRLLALP